MTAWPFRSRPQKAVFVLCVALVSIAAPAGLSFALIGGEFELYSIVALTVGLGAVLIIAGQVVVELVSRKFHPESGLFTWSDVDTLRDLAVRSADDPETREWARSLADRIAVVLPGRPAR